MIFAALALAAPPSFDCAKASTKVETMICGDEELAAADRAVARLYAAVPSSEKQIFWRKQTDWLAERDRCDDKACLVLAYEDRLAEMFVVEGQVKTRDYTMKGNPSGTLSIFDVGGGWSAFFAQAIWIGPDSMTAPETTAHDTQVAGVFRFDHGARPPKDEFECGWTIQRLSGDRWRLRDWPGTNDAPCGAVNASVEGIYRR
jgi:uncharacterized protein YecT (DUF1311 family)